MCAALTLRNSGTGHDFPTCVTPKVVVEIFQEDQAGRAVAGTRREYVIARQVPLDLSREIADSLASRYTLFEARRALRAATK